MIADTDKIRVELERLTDLPVTSWVVEEGLDATDDEALWVWALIEDGNVDADARWRLTSMAREVVRNETGGRLWAYVRIRDALEEDETA